MREKFNELRVTQASLEKLETVNDIIEEYGASGYRLTLRQLYYQLVSRDIIPNQSNEYDKLGILLVKGRMAGVVDWSAIEDRLRRPQVPYSVLDKAAALYDTVEQYRLNRQSGQDNYIEVWVEKDALSGVILRKTDHYHIRLMVNRGYSSASAMYVASKRFLRAESNGQNPVILYLGDHDPSGLDMIRDVIDRLWNFGVEVDVRHIALTMPQIEELDPPPNPAKLTDPRGTGYVEEFGAVSWEVDAISPERLHEILDENIQDLMDMDLFESMIAVEDEDKGILQEMADRFDEDE